MLGSIGPGGTCCSWCGKRQPGSSWAGQRPAYLPGAAWPPAPSACPSPFPLQGLNKALAWAALTLLALVFLPSVLARLAQYALRASLGGPTCLPPWLAAWLGARKQLGLLGAGLAGLHALISCLLFMPAYYSKMFQKQVG